MSGGVRLAMALCLVVLLGATAGGCACRPAYVGPAGYFHPARCYY